MVGSDSTLPDPIDDFKQWLNLNGAGGELGLPIPDSFGLIENNP
jgi:hypothetical protein